MRNQLLRHIKNVFKRVNALEENFAFIYDNLEPCTLLLLWLAFDDFLFLQHSFVIVTGCTNLEFTLEGTADTLLRSLLTELRMKVFDLVFNDLRIAKAALINHLGAGFLDKWMRWESFLEESPLHREIDRKIHICVRHDKVKDVD